MCHCIPRPLAFIGSLVFLAVFLLLVSVRPSYSSHRPPSDMRFSSPEAANPAASGGASPVALELVSLTALPDIPQQLAVNDGLVSIADGDGGLQIVDASDPAAPAIVGSYVPTGFVASDIALAGPYAYLAGSSNSPAWVGVQVLDLSTPTTPTLTGSYTLTNALGSVNAIASSGSRLYLAGQDNTAAWVGMQVLDMSTPTTPTHTASYTLATSGLAGEIAGDSSVAYLRGADYETGWRGVMLLDVRTPSRPTVTSRYTMSAVADMDLVGTTLSLVEQDEGWYGLVILDASDPHYPTVTGRYTMATSVLDIPPGEVYAAGPSAYLTGNMHGSPLHVVNVRDSANPVRRGSINLSDTVGRIVYDLRAEDGLIYVAIRDGLLILREHHAPAQVQMAGPTYGTLDTTYSFTATVGYTATTTPLTYTWHASDHAPVVHATRDSLTDTLSLLWGSTGPHTVTVRVENIAGSSVATHTITIDDAPPPPTPATSPRLSALPSRVRPGGKLHFTGYAFDAGKPHTIRLHCEGQQTDIEPLAVDTTRNGTLHTAMTLPISLTAGVCNAGIYSLSMDLLDIVPVNVLPSISLTLNPTSGPPGTVVHFDVTGDLTPGTVRIDYDGVPIVGPVSIWGGDYSGTFVVPADRPDPLGSLVSVMAVHKVGSTEMAVTGTSFQSQPLTEEPRITFERVRIAAKEVVPAQPFSITGKITPLPEGPLDDYRVKFLWKKSDGKTFPIGDESTTLNDDGSFIGWVRGPDILAGDPAMSSADDYILVGLAGPAGVAVPPDLEVLVPPPEAMLELRVRVVNEQQQPIEGAFVDIVSLDHEDAEALYGAPPNQVSQWADEQGYLSSELLFDSSWFAPCNVPRTTVDGLYEAVFGKIDALINPSPLEYIVYGEVLQQTARSAARAHTRSLRPLPTTQEQQAAASEMDPLASKWEPYLAIVDAIDQGYGEMNELGTPAPTARLFEVHTETGEIRDPASDTTGDTFTIVLPELPESYKAALFGHVEHTGPVVGLAPVANDPAVTLDESGEPLAITLFLYMDSDVSGLVKEEESTISIDGRETTLTLTENTRTVCSGQMGMMSGKVSYYKVVIPLTLLSPGEQEITFNLMMGEEVQSYPSTILVEPLPDWFLSSRYTQRTAKKTSSTSQNEQVFHIVLTGTIPPKESTVLANQDAPGSAKEHKSTTYIQTRESQAHIGTSTQTTVYEEDGRTTHHFSSEASATALNEQSTSYGINSEVALSEASSSTVAQCVALLSDASAADTIPIDPHTEEILNTGYFPVVPNTPIFWPPLLGARWGMDLWLQAQLAYCGSIVYGPSGDVDTTLHIVPSADVRVKAWIDVDILFDLVTNARAEALPDIAMFLPFTMHNGNVSNDGLCFTYAMDLYWYVRAGPKVCDPSPFDLGCVCICKSWSDTEHLFSGDVPGGCTDSTFAGGSPPPICPAAASTSISAPSSANLSINPQPEPPGSIAAKLATDGLGHTILLQIDATETVRQEQYLYRTHFYEGGEFRPGPLLPVGPLADTPEIAFFAPEQAIAVWTESPLDTPELRATTSFSDALKTQHVVYALWDGVEWSEPYSLTTATTGEGGVALASCMSTEPDCPEGGAVVAVWVRDVVGDYSQHHFHLFYAIYHNGAWSNPHPVDGDNTTAFDGQPQVAYRRGTPLVAWVRDPDRSFGTHTDRRIALRLLDGVSGVSEPQELPGSIVAFSLALDTAGNPHLAFTRAEGEVGLVDNRHTLYSGAQTCETCGWGYHRLTDLHGRPIYAEKPILTIDNQNNSVITYRSFGAGPLPGGGYATFPEDTVGAQVRTGELAQLVATFDGQPHTPSYLTNDGAVYMKPETLYDPITNDLLTVAIPGEPASQQVQAHLASLAAANGQPQQRPGLETVPLSTTSGTVFASVSLDPDFVVEPLVPTTRHPHPGQHISVDVPLRNDGLTAPGDGSTNLDIVATWDGGPGGGEQAGSMRIVSPGAGQAVSVTLTVAPPAEGYDTPHTLIVTANPRQEISERTASNNKQETTIGGLPAPTDVTAMVKPGEERVYLQWPPADHPQIAGYRVYRGTAGETLHPVGSTFITGFLDLTSKHNQEYQYAIASYSESGIESEQRATARASTPSIALAAVEVTGPTTGTVSIPASFTAVVSPVLATLPITYTWEVVGQPTLTREGSRLDRVAYQWEEAGVKEIVVTASSATGTASASHRVDVVAGSLPQQRLYLPLVRR